MIQSVSCIFVFFTVSASELIVFDESNLSRLVFWQGMDKQMLTNGALCQTRHIMTCASSVTGVDHSGTALYVVCSNVLSVEVCMISLVIRGSEGFEKVKCGEKAVVHVTQ